MIAQTVATLPGPDSTAHTSGHLSLALAAVDAARAQLDRYALATDTPAWQAVDAADALDTARASLTKAVCDG